MSDISLVPMEDIVSEIERRHKAFVLATLREESGNVPVVRTVWSEGTFIDCLGICSALEYDLKKAYIEE